jgi:hypothetical protein
MFGQLVFADIPFASIGQPPYIERGWIKDCPQKNEWNKLPTEVTGWQVVDRSKNDWDKRPSNDVNTIECGDFKPTNLPGLKN